MTATLPHHGASRARHPLPLFGVLRPLMFHVTLFDKPPPLPHRGGTAYGKTGWHVGTPAGLARGFCGWGSWCEELAPAMGKPWGQQVEDRGVYLRAGQKRGSTDSEPERSGRRKSGQALLPLTSKPFSRGASEAPIPETGKATLCRSEPGHLSPPESQTHRKT